MIDRTLDNQLLDIKEIKDVVNYWCNEGRIAQNNYERGIQDIMYWMNSRHVSDYLIPRGRDSGYNLESTKRYIHTLRSMGHLKEEVNSGTIETEAERID